MDMKKREGVSRKSMLGHVNKGKVLYKMSTRDHSSIASAKRWVGGVRKWHFLLINSTIYADVGWLLGL